MEPLYPNLILDALRHVRYPGNGTDIVSNGMVEDDIRIDGAKVSFSLLFDRNPDPFAASVVRSAESAIATYISPEVEIKGNIAIKYRQPAPKPVKMLPGVKNIIGVSSGKGGVGKSTVASNLAVSLAQMGYKVGLLDADIFGPSAPKMFGLEDAEVYMERQPDGGALILPPEAYGVKVLSIGFLVDKDSAVLWRGGMASNALKQLIGEAKWGDLDYFVIDMPPGTGDVPLTVFQTLPVDGVVIVTSPQDLVQMIVKKAYNMAAQMNIPVIGIVENYSYLECPDCGKKISVFGESHIDEIAADLQIPVLGKMPIDPKLAEIVEEEKAYELDNKYLADAVNKL